ncbi:MAG: DNA polymerase I [Bdellovibrionales bacterium]|nr:DNA polymerase I [Bdellovibrionales bacterium]
MNKIENKTVYLVDASSIFFRAYYAIPFMQSQKTKIQTSAIYGYLTTTLKILEQFKPQYLVYCFDRKEPTHRVKYYKEYKANREEMPEDLEEQVPYIHKVTDLMGIQKMDLKGYEADDLIGSLACWSKNKKAQVVVISSDKDFAQLVDNQIKLYDPMKDIYYDNEGVQKKWGVKPNQIVDYLAIVGDSSDNIPGVRGIGQKGAQKLLLEYKTMDDIYSNIDKVPEKLAQKLKDSKKEAFLSQKLARIITDLKLVSGFKDFERQPLQKQEMLELLDNLEFRSIRRKMFADAEDSKKKKVSSVSKEKLPQKIKGLRKYSWSLNELQESLKPYEEVGVAVLDSQVHLFLKKAWVQVQTKSLNLVGELLSHKKVKWWGYDLKSIWKEMEVKSPIASWDLMVAGYLVENKPSTDLISLVRQVCGEEELNEENIIPLLVDLRKHYEQKIEEMKLDFVFQNIEMPLVSVLYKMERRGVLINHKQLLLEKTNLECDLLELENQIFAQSGHPFNIASPQQLAYVLFDEMGLAKGRKTKTGFSTDSDVLQALTHHHPIAQLILDYRELFKLKTTYVEGLLEAIDKKTKRVHTQFKQTITATGRLSSAHPNLQNIPIRTSRGRQIRKVFVSKKDHVLISADYSQIELRILALFSKDPGLKEAFLKGEDIHKSTAKELFNVPLDEVSAEQRRIAKAVNFGITYGQTAFGLSETLGVSRFRGGELVDQYFKKFSKVRDYIESHLAQARKTGYVETLFGRRRMIPELFSKNVRLKKFGERAAVNASIQGTASDLVKLAMVHLNASVWSRLLIQVHDELLFECPKEGVEYEKTSIQEIMEGEGVEELSLDIPLKVNIGSGSNWDEAYK